MAYWALENQDKNLSGENYFRCSTLRKILLYIAQTSAYYWYIDISLVEVWISAKVNLQLTLKKYEAKVKTGNWVIKRGYIVLLGCRKSEKITSDALYAGNLTITIRDKNTKYELQA
jgi:hypothetical protein